MSSDPVLITGVGKRIGLHLAKSFMARNIPVIGTYRTERDSLDPLRECGAKLYHCDFYDEGDTGMFIEAITANHERLRAIIHNASEWLTEASGDDAQDTIRRMMQIHVTTPYRLNLALAPLLKAGSGDHGDIIHVGDYVSAWGSQKHIAYAASKAAQDNLTLSFAARLAPKVKVNSIAPALVLFNDDDDTAHREKTLKKSLMRREGGLEEFQHTIDYLMTSRFVTGRTIHIDGGRHLAAI